MTSLVPIYHNDEVNEETGRFNDSYVDLQIPTRSGRPKTHDMNIRLSRQKLWNWNWLNLTLVSISYTDLWPKKQIIYYIISSGDISAARVVGVLN